MKGLPCDSFSRSSASGAAGSITWHLLHMQIPRPLLRPSDEPECLPQATLMQTHCCLVANVSASLSSL